MKGVSDFFTKGNATIPMNRQQDIHNPVLYADKDPEIYIVTTNKDKAQAGVFKRILHNSFHRDVEIMLLYAFSVIPSRKEEESLLKFAETFAVDFSKYIPDYSKIVTIGKALNVMTEDSNMTPMAFYNMRALPTYFYYPPCKSWIFPADSTAQFWSYEKKKVLDSFHTMFLYFQLDASVKFDVPRLRIPKLRVIDLNTKEKADVFLDSHIGKQEDVSFDLETSGLLWYNDSILCITLSFDGVTGYYIRWRDVDVKRLDAFFKDKYCIGQNIKFDCKFLRYNGVRSVKIDWDTLNASQLVNEGGYAPSSLVHGDLPIHGLAVLGWMYSYYGGHKNEMTHYRKAHNISNFGHVPEEVLVDYATKDAIVTYDVYKHLRKIIDSDEGWKRFYYNELVPNLNMFLRIEMRDVVVDFDEIRKMDGEFTATMERYKNLFYDEAVKLKVLGTERYVKEGKDYSVTEDDRNKWKDYLAFDIESASQVGKAFEELGLPCEGRGKDGFYSTADMCLSAWVKYGYPIAEMLARYREFGTFLKMFIGKERNPRSGSPTAYWTFKDRKKNAIHPTYSVMLADSHRNKCQSPNYQQIPKQGEMAGRFRQCFKTPDQNEQVMSDKYVTLSLGDGRVLEIPYGERCEIIRDGNRDCVLVEELKDTDQFIGVNTIDN